MQGRAPPPSRGASDFNVSVGELAAVPRKNATELLKLAPGILLTNEGGEGHAEQVFLRGFDAREGQDIEFSVGGVPINESGNLHGNGYADTHFIIPELVESLARRRGPVRSAPGQLRRRRQRRLRARPRAARAHRQVHRRAASEPQRAAPALGPARRDARTPSAARSSTRPTASGRTATRKRGSAMGQYEGQLRRERLVSHHRARRTRRSYHTAGVIREDDYRRRAHRLLRHATTSGGRAATRRATRSPATSRRKAGDVTLTQQVFLI